MKIDKCNISNELKEFSGIYVFFNTKYFYVGQSVHVIERIEQHKRALRKNAHANIFIQRVYNKYKDLDPFIYQPIVLCNPNDLDYFELYYYEELKLLNPDMIPMNIAKCGDNTNTYQSRIKKSESHTGKHYSKEHCEAISRGLLGIKRPKQWVKIVQLDKQGNLIKIWDSLQEAKETLNISILLCRKSSGGYVWQKYDEWIKNPKLYVLDTVKPVEQWTKDGKLIAVYSSITEAAKQTKIKHCDISNTVTGKLKSAGGYIWKYQK